MTRKRTPPVADHIESQPTGEGPSNSGPVGPEPAATEPDIFDRVIAARAEGRFELPENTPAAPVAAPAALTGPPAAVKPPVLPIVRAQPPNPRALDQISLEADDQKGLKMRLLRFRHDRGNEQDVWIQFDKNPGKEVTDPIKAAGFRWEPRAEVGDRAGAWIKPLEPGREVRTMLDAERMFKDLGNQIRKSNGLEPVGQMGSGVA